ILAKTSINVSVWRKSRITPDYRTDVNRTVYPKPHVVPDNTTKLRVPRILSANPDHRMVVPEVCNLCAGTEFAPAPDNRIPDIVKMGNLCPCHDDGIFDFRAVPYMAIVADAGCSPNIRVGTYPAVVPDYAGTLDAGSRFYHRILTDNHRAGPVHSLLHGSVILRYERSQKGRVSIE